MTSLWSDHVAGLQPYIPGEQLVIPNLLKLNTNENPYGPSPLALDAMRAALGDNLRLYPEYTATALRESIAKLHNINADQVFLGNGSDEVLAHIFNAFFLRNNRPLVLPDITYSFYKTYCSFYKVPHQYIPLTADFAIDVNDYTNLSAINPCGIIFANPNAPTGKAMSLADIAKIASANPDATVVIDEAYVDFGAESAIKLVQDFKNLLVVHTLSKSRSLAGLRVGFAIGHTDMIQALLRIKDSFNSYPLDSIALAGAKAAIDDENWFQQCCDRIITDRQQLSTDLQALGFEILPSQTNFVFARHTDHNAKAIAVKLREHGILVRHFAMPRIDQFLRITVGTRDQCQRLCDTLSVVLNNIV